MKTKIEKPKAPNGKLIKEDDTVGKLLIVSFLFSCLIITVIGMILKIGQ